MQTFDFRGKRAVDWDHNKENRTDQDSRSKTSLSGAP